MSAKICTGIPCTSVLINKAVTSKYSSALKDFFSDCSVPTQEAGEKGKRRFKLVSKQGDN